MKKIIVFGATGNVGSYFTLYLNEYFKDKFEIVAIGRKNTNFFSKFNIKYYKCDISNFNNFVALPKDDVHAVVLLAATIPSYMSKYDPRSYIDSNTVGAYNVFEYAKNINVDRILYTQTVFDIHLSLTNSRVSPNTARNFSYKGDHAVYVISKNTAVELLRHYHEEYGIKQFVFRLPTIYNYSPYYYYYPNGIKTKRPVYTMIENAINSKPIELWGDPNYTKDMVYVADFSQMLSKAIVSNKNSGFYNVGTGIPVTLEEQIKTIIKVFSPKDNPSTIIYKKNKIAGGGSLFDISNAIEELGYKPEYDCEKLFMEYKKEMELNRFNELLDRQ